MQLIDVFFHATSEGKRLMENAKACVTGSAEVRIFCTSVSESTAGSITLLKAIEHTVRWNTLLQNRARADADFAYKAAEDLRECERVKVIDSDGTICVLLEGLEDSIKNLHKILLEKQAAANRTPELNGDHKIAVVDEYAESIAAISDLHGAITELKWAVGEHDADLEKPEDAVFSDKDKLRAYLTAL